MIFSNSKLKNYTLGSNEDLVLDVRIRNQGEDAYRSRVFLRAPDGVNFGKFIVTYNGSPGDITPFCTTIPQNYEIQKEKVASDEARNEFIASAQENYLQQVCNASNFY